MSLDSFPIHESKNTLFLQQEPLVTVQSSSNTKLHILNSVPPTNTNTSDTDSKSYSHLPQDPNESSTILNRYGDPIPNNHLEDATISNYNYNNNNKTKKKDQDLHDEYHENEIPKIHWKDQLTNCCKYGICHPSYICGCCCSIFGIAQVLFRVISSPRIKRLFFWTITLFFMGHFILEYILYLNIGKYCIPDMISFIRNGADRNQIWLDPTCRKWMDDYGRFSYVYFAITVVAVAIARHFVRKKYSILPSCHRRRRQQQQQEQEVTSNGNTNHHHHHSSCDDGWIEDCCFSFFCASCVTAQMMRHTGNYESCRASFCSYTGLTLIPRKKTKVKRTNKEVEEVILEVENGSRTLENGIC